MPLRTRFARSLYLLAGFASLAGLGAPAYADTVLETETAQLGKKGDSLISASVQFETSKTEGQTQFSLNQYEYALSDRAELLIEPFFYEHTHPKEGDSVHGMGDLEITPSYLVLPEEKYGVATLVAFKLKVPTATHDLGTGKFDYQPYIILGKTFGDNWILNANIGYDFVTSPDDQKLKNQAILDFSVERKLSDTLSVYAETFYNSKASDDESSNVSGAIATEYHFTKHFNAFVSVGYDSHHLFNVRPGFNFEF